MITQRTNPPTDAELRDAHRRAGLETSLGIDFDTAMASPSLRSSLTGMVNSDRRWASSTLRYGSLHLQYNQGDKA